MSNIFYTQHQWKVFADYLRGTFIRSGFEVIDEPYIDYALQGFRATYLRRYLLQRPTPFSEGILSTIISVVGLPFGHQGQKMVIMSLPRDLENAPVADALKMRIQIDNEGRPLVVHGDHLQTTPTSSNSNEKFNGQQSNLQQEPTSKNNEREIYDGLRQFMKDLTGYVLHLLEIISPGLIELPTEMKLEILKKLSIDSIIRMSQVNSEFRTLIFQRGESLWRHLCYRDFKLKTINRMLHRSWLELYRDTYMLEQIEICRKERALPGLPERPALPPPINMLQIEWLPEVLELPFYPLHDDEINNNQLPIPFALEYYPRRRADSLDSLNV